MRSSLPESANSALPTPERLAGFAAGAADPQGDVPGGVVTAAVCQESALGDPDPGVVHRCLQERVAALLGKETALWLPTGCALVLVGCLLTTGAIVASVVVAC